MSFAPLDQTSSKGYAGRRQASAQQNMSSGGKSSGGLTAPGISDPQRQQIDAQNQMFSGTITPYLKSMSGAQDLYNQSRPGIDTVDQNSAGQTGQSALQTGAQGLGSAQSFFNQYQNAIFGQQPPMPTISMPAFSTGSDGQRYDTQGNILPNMPGAYQPDFVMQGEGMQPGPGPDFNQGGAGGQPPMPPANPLLDVLKQYAPAAAPLVRQNLPRPVAQPPRPPVQAPQGSFAGRQAQRQAPQQLPGLFQPQPKFDDSLVRAYTTNQ